MEEIQQQQHKKTHTKKKRLSTEKQKKNKKWREGGSTRYWISRHITPRATSLNGHGGDPAIPANHRPRSLPHLRRFHRALTGNWRQNGKWPPRGKSPNIKGRQKGKKKPNRNLIWSGEKHFRRSHESGSGTSALARPAPASWTGNWYLDCPNRRVASLHPPNSINLLIDCLTAANQLLLPPPKHRLHKSASKKYKYILIHIKKDKSQSFPKKIPKKSGAHFTSADDDGFHVPRPQPTGTQQFHKRSKSGP